MPATRASRKRPLEEHSTIHDSDEQETKQSKQSHDTFRTSLAQYQYTASPPPISRAPSAPLHPPSPSRPPRRRKPQGYAPPSTYAHLPPLQDVLTPNLIAVFIGTNPGIATATQGHAYAHPSNLFWKLLHSSGCTTRRLAPSEDGDLPRLFALGNTNLVGRPTRDAGQLSAAELRAGTPALEGKIARCRPEAVCVVGKGIWEAVFHWWNGRALAKGEFRYGWQTARMGAGDGWDGARVYVASSTSGLSASLLPREKEAIWAPFGAWVAERRKERAALGVENPVFEREAGVM